MAAAQGQIIIPGPPATLLLPVPVQQYIENQVNERTSLLRAELEKQAAIGTERDKQYDQRFKAAELAVQVGLTAAKTATDAALIAQKESSASAFAAAEKAITKSDAATEKRFEGVNEFRKTLDDAQRVLMPRNEALALIANQDSKLAANDKQIGLLQIGMVSSVTQLQYADLQKQVNDLREARSGAQGAAAVADPELLRMAADVRALLATQKQAEGKDKQVDHTTSRDQWIIGLLVGGGIAFAGLIIGAVTLISKLVPTPTAAPAATLLLTALHLIGF